MCRFLGSLLLLALLFFSQPSSAQMTMMGVSGNQPSGASYTGPGDLSISATTFFFHSCSFAFTGALASAHTKLCNWSRASDSHTCDILAASTGGMGVTANCSTPADNGQSLTSFCTATTCSAIDWYDQSSGNHCGGAACNATAAVATAPTLGTSCIGTTNAGQFAGASSQSVVTGANTAAIAQPISLVSVFKSTATAFQGAQGDSNFAIGQTSGAQVFIYAGTEIDKTGANNSPYVLQAVLNGASSAMAVNATQFTALNAGTGAHPVDTTYSIGANGGSQFLTGCVGENWVLNGSALSTTDMTTIYNNTHTRYGF